MIKRFFSGLLQNLLLALLKSLLILVAVLLQVVRQLVAAIRDRRKWNWRMPRLAWKLPHLRLSKAWLVTGSVVVLLITIVWNWPVRIDQPKPKYFAADLRIPDESIRFVGNDSLFLETLVAMGHRLDMDPAWILAVMFHESRLNPAALNHRGSGATGLIQFMGPALQDLNSRMGTRYYLSDVRKMDAITQLRLVEAYYQMVQERYGPIRNFTDAYLAVLFPRSIGNQSSHVLFSKPSRKYFQNSGLDMNKDGHVTVGDISTRLYRMFPDLSENGMVGLHPVGQKRLN